MANNTSEYAASKGITDWKFHDYHVGSDRGGRNQGKFINPESVLVAAAPARHEDLAGNGGQGLSSIIPMGAADNISVNQSRMIQQIFEIGSRRGYFLNGHTNATLSISRPMLSGASVLRVITAATRDHEDLDNPAGYNLSGADSAIEGDDYDANTPELYINLQAEIFDRPTGMVFYMKDQRSNPYAAVYVEDANVQMHSFSIVSQGLAMPENMSMMFDRIIPINMFES